MPVHYRKLFFDSRDHEMVSNQWFVLLYNIHKYGDHRYNINEGHRTMARQAQLVKEKGLWSPSNPTGAAAPSPKAPHIRTGRPDHAVDVDNAALLIDQARKRGVTLRRPIPTEPWHVEADAKELKAYHDKKAAGVWADLRKKHGEAEKPKPKPPARAVSSKGVAFIAEFEGGQGRDGLFHPYKDPVGIWTIGYGHTDGVGPKSKPLTKKQALALLKKDINKKYTPPVLKALKAAGVRPTQNELDALVSAVYNLGPGILDKGRTMGDAIRSKSRHRMGDAFLVYNKAGSPPKSLPGLTRRRKAERKLFLTK